MGGEAEAEAEAEEEVPFESVETDEEPVEEAEEEVAEEADEELTEASLEKVAAPKGGDSDGTAMSHNRGDLKIKSTNSMMGHGGEESGGAAPSVNKGGMDTKAPLENESK